MNKEKLKEAITFASKDGRITCEKAFEIAGEFKCSLKEVGNMCNDMNIKIISCQLGCF